MPERAAMIPGGRRAARSAKAGFTLIELAMVAMLMGLLVVAILVVGFLATRNKEQLKSEARALAGFLEQVRTNAAVKGKRYTVQYDLDDADMKYFVWGPQKVEEGDVVEPSSDPDEETRVGYGFHQFPTRNRADGTRTYGVWIDRIGFGDGTSTDDSVVKIDFLPTGGGHWHMVYLTNEDEDFYTIVVNPFTGAAEVYPGEYKPPEPERLR